jgi:hypothetical protein
MQVIVGDGLRRRRLIVASGVELNRYGRTQDSGHEWDESRPNGQ